MKNPQEPRALQGVTISGDVSAPSMKAGRAISCDWCRFLPAISGRPDTAPTLTCTPGGWTGAASFSYHWLRDNVPITAGSTHRPTAGDIGHKLACKVTAINTAGSTSAASATLRVIDRTPPVVRSLKNSGQRGRIIRLHYRVRDNSGIMRDVITVNRGVQQVTRISAKLGRADWSNVYYVRWRAPRSGTVSASASSPGTEPATEATKAATRSRCADRATPVS